MPNPNKYVKIDVTDYYALCDAIRIAPDAHFKQVIEQAKLNNIMLDKHNNKGKKPLWDFTIKKL